MRNAEEYKERRQSKISIGGFFCRPDRSFYLAEELRKRGFEVVLYNNRGVEGTYVYVDYGLPKMLHHLLFRTRHDIYFTSLSYLPSLSLFLNKVLRRIPYVFVLTGMMWEEFSDESKVKRLSDIWSYYIYPFLLKCILSGANKIICNSCFLKGKLIERYPEFGDKTVVIYNGIDINRYSSGTPMRLPGINGEDTILFSMTNLNYKRKLDGIKFLLNSISKVFEEKKSVKLVLALKVADLKDANPIEEYINSSSWKNRITSLYNREDIPNLLASADIFVYSSFQDSLPRSILEAQAAGLPVVTTDTCGCKEGIIHSKTGLAVECKEDVFAKAVLELIEDSELRGRFGQNAIEWVGNQFNWTRMAEEYSNIFLEIAHREK